VCDRVVSERVVCSRGVCVCDRVVSKRVLCSRGVRVCVCVCVTELRLKE